jgi:molybdate/tungstate transport system ATP-binding protein
MIGLENVSWDAGVFHLKSISFTVPQGKYAVLMGKTGTGKTTLLEIVCGLRTPLTGTVQLEGQDVTREAPGERGIGYVPQDGALFPAMKVGDQIAFGWMRRCKDRRVEEPRIRQIVQELAEETGIAHLLERWPQGLSGGERQRVALARALALRPRILLLDEPLASLDEETQDEIMPLLQRMQRQHGITVLHVTHSRREAERLGEQRLRLHEGQVLEE